MPTTSELQPLLLDTHIWLWLVLGTGRLSTVARGMIAKAATFGRLRIASITMWEIALLASRNRIALGKSTLQWIEQAVTDSFVTVEPLTAMVAVESWELPDRFHQDPVDRMIVATARVSGAVLMTRDRQILDYAARGHLTAIAA
jgi:PIN domain nuclease of toxin-antitoxin system